MPLKPQRLIALLDDYLNMNSKNWRSLGSTVLKIFTLGFSSAETERRNTCDEFKKKFNQLSEKSSIEDKIKICIELGNASEKPTKSLLARYLHALRTYILNEISTGDSKIEFTKIVADMKAKLPDMTQSTVKLTEEQKKVLTDLVLLGDSESIANVIKLFPNAIPDPSYFQNDYYSTKFLAQEINIDTRKYGSFDSFIDSLPLTVSSADQKQEKLEAKQETVAARPIKNESKSEPEPVPVQQISVKAVKALIESPMKPSGPDQKETKSVVKETKEIKDSLVQGKAITIQPVPKPKQTIRTFSNVTMGNPKSDDAAETTKSTNASPAEEHIEQEATEEQGKRTMSLSLFHKKSTPGSQTTFYRGKRSTRNSNRSP